MKKKTILILITALMLLCCACAAAETTPPTAEEIVLNMQEALKETPCTQLETVMTYSMVFDAGEMGTMETTTESSTRMTVSLDPVSSYSVATAKVTTAGETAESVTENYTVTEDGQMVAYVKSNGIWMKMVTGQTPEELTGSASSVGVDAANVAVDETITQWNDRQVICLKASMDGNTVKNSMATIFESISALGSDMSESLDAVDYSSLRAETVLYLDPETYLPIAQEMVLDGMSEVLAPLLQDSGMTVTVTECTISGNYLSYEPQSPVTLPEGTAEKAEIWTRLLSGESDNGDGTFTIREGLVLIDLTHPEGFEVKEKDYDHVTFTRDDYRQITYMISYIRGEATPGSGEYFLTINNSSEKRWNSNGGKVQRQQMEVETDTLPFTCDILGTTWGSGREDANIYAWTPLASDGTGTYYLYVEITDGASDGFGFSKSADITPEEFVEYLNAAAPSKVTAE